MSNKYNADVMGLKKKTRIQYSDTRKCDKKFTM